jgi:DNA polymerase (family 10)
MNFPKINLHIHSNFSDGSNTIKRVVKKSLKLELDYIAITDHFTNSWKASVINTLSSESKINEYLEELSICQNQLKENNCKLKLFKGIEIDLESSESYIKQLIQPQKFDIILFEYLESSEGIVFMKKIIDYWKNAYNLSNYSPIFGLAHFDPSYFIHGALDNLITFLKEYSIYFEFNSRYPNYYSLKNELFFKKLGESQISVAIGSDSHNYRQLDDIEEPLEMLKSYRLEENFIQILKLIKK